MQAILRERDLLERRDGNDDGADERIVIAEGAGGLLVPLSANYSMRELALDLGWPLLVAALPGLGTLNHTLLTLEAAHTAGLEVGGFLFAPSEASSPLAQELDRDNAQTIERISGCPFLGMVPRWLAPESFELEQHPSDRWLAERFPRATA